MSGFADVEDVLRDETPVLLVAEQDSFVSNGNVFCVLVPLMTNDGERFEDPVEAFPNRGRVWWLAGHDGIDREPRHGDIVTGSIEPAPNYTTKDPEKERYQIRRGWRPGSTRWWQVLDLSERNLEVPDLVADAGIPWESGAPVTRIVVRLKDAVVGPFNARLEDDGESLLLTALNLSKPTARRLPLAEFSRLTTTERFDDLTVFPNNRRVGAVPFPLEFLHERYAKVLDQGALVDASNEKSLVKWALGVAQVTSAQRNAFTDALGRVASYVAKDEPDAAERMQRFKAICNSAERVAALGPEIAAELARTDGFRKLVEDHIAEITTKRIEDEVLRRKVDIEAAITALEKRRSALEVEYDDAKKRQEEALARDNKARLEDLDRRENEVARREQAADEKEQGIAARLEKLIETYRSESERVGNEILTQLPILMRTGIGPQASAPPRESPTAARAIGAVFLERPVPQEAITESQFLDQLRSVAAARGCVFSEDDLKNFHVTVKTGTWSVLAGSSGIGKSTLPRIYAEALGMKNEFLEIAVRPDWLDDRDVVGAFNPLTSRFEPAATGLVDRLVTAYEDATSGRGGVYVICLDEMNLARVEHYFAQFLSILERPEGERTLTLFGQALERSGDPYSRYRELQLGDNLRFVGTVNIDETTHFFSPKVLDRAAIVTLEDSDHSRQQARTLKSRELAVRPVHIDVYRSWIKDHPAAPATVRELLLQVDARLRRMRSGLGFRLFNRMLKYVASSADLLAPDRALDFALAQSMLPRIPTHHPEFQKEGAALLELLPADRFPRVARILGPMKDSGGEHGFFQLV